MADNDIKRYQIPTHLKTEDKLTIGFFTFTLRQLAVLLLGGGLAVEVWHRFPVAALALLLGEVLANWLKEGSVLLLVLATLALALVKRRGRTLESWFMLWLRYRMLPRCYRWRRLPDPLFRSADTPAKPSAAAPEEERA